MRLGKLSGGSPALQNPRPCSASRLIIERMAKVREHHTRTMSGRLGSTQADWASHDLAIDLPHDSEPLLDGPQ